MTQTSGYISETFRRLAAESEARGEARGIRDAIHRVLRVRGLLASPDQRRRIDACDDLDVLRRWLDRAEVAHTTVSIFESER